MLRQSLNVPEFWKWSYFETFFGVFCNRFYRDISPALNLNHSEDLVVMVFLVSVSSNESITPSPLAESARNSEVNILLRAFGASFYNTP